MELNMLNCVEVDLVFSGEDADLNDFITEVGIFPSKVKGTNDWPRRTW